MVSRMIRLSDKSNPFRTRQMTFFVDTADSAEIRSLAANRLLDGVATDYDAIIREANVQRRAALLADRAKTGQTFV